MKHFTIARATDGRTDEQTDTTAATDVDGEGRRDGGPPRIAKLRPKSNFKAARAHDSTPNERTNERRNANERHLSAIYQWGSEKTGAVLEEYG